MTIKLFTIWDSKTEAFRYPHFVQNSGQAIRSFQEAVMDTKIELGKYPEDFSLFEMGTLDDSTGVYTALNAPLNLGLGTLYVSNKEDSCKA